MNQPARSRSAAPTLEPVAELLANGRFQRPTSSDYLARLAQFDVVQLLGGGGMGWVFLGRDSRAGSQYAIKLLKSEWLKDTRVRHRFQVEAHHMQRLDHPHILKVLDVCDLPDNPYFIMPYQEKGSLTQWIHPGQPLNYELTLRVIGEVASALHYAHLNWVVHRDLKPDNVLLDAYSRARLTDFGLAIAFNNHARENRRQPGEGTAPFMSPAVAAGQPEDIRSDIYSLGAMLYEMLTGHLPYHGATVDEIRHKIHEGPPVPVEKLNPRSSPALAFICKAAMARDPRERYRSMAEMITELTRVRQGAEPMGPAHLSRTIRRWPWQRQLTHSTTLPAAGGHGSSRSRSRWFFF